MHLVTKWNEDVRPQKAVARDYVFRGVGRCRHALFLPAAACLCISKALDYGVIDQDSEIIAVEKDPDVARAMIQTLRKLEVSALAYHCMLHTVRLPFKLDLAFVDLNGILDLGTTRWLTQHLASHMKTNATVIFTLAHAWRNNRFIPRCHNILFGKHRDLMLNTLEEMRCDNLDILMMIVLFRSIFWNWSFKIDFRLKYRDTGSVPMTAYRLCQFRRQPNPVYQNLMQEILRGANA